MNTLVSRRASEFLNHIAEVALVDVVNRGLLLKRGNRRRRAVVHRRIKRWTADEGSGCGGFGDFVGELVEVSEEMIPVGGGGGISGG